MNEINRVTRDPAIPHQLTHFLRAFLALEWLGLEWDGVIEAYNNKESW